MMAKIVSAGHHQKVTPIMTTWSVSSAHSASNTRKLNHSAGNCNQDAAQKGDTCTLASSAAPCTSSASVATKCKSSISSSVHSSSVCSLPSESKWTSFDESEEEPSSERHSDQHGLLPSTDDAMSEGDDGVDDDSYVITPTLREYYASCFKDLLKKTRGTCDLASAVRGQDPGVFDFFLKSKLTRDQLGKVWKLADVNEDGFLNFEEFCAAMHLIVRRVKGNFPIPDSLPKLLMPAKTPPRNVTPREHDWTHFDGAQDRKSSSLPRMRVTMAVDESDMPLKDFSDCLMLTTDKTDTLACPIACRLSPGAEEGSFGERPANKGGKGAPGMVISPHAPKGPPPKPPPRPVVRHVRSASLDLTKSVPKQVVHAPPPSAPAPKLPPGKAKTTLRNRSREASAQTDSAVVGPGSSSAAATSSSLVKVLVDNNEELKRAKGDGHAIVTLSTNSATAVKRDIPNAAHIEPQLRSAAEAAVESKDWLERCRDTSRLNALLERELKQLTELRIGLESELNNLRRQKPSSSS